MSVTVKDVAKNSISYKKRIGKDWELISINGNDIYDVLDYDFYLKE